jgi:hypothetical protein
MYSLTITEKNNLTDFFKAALNIYREDENWVAPLNVEVEQILNKDSNKLLQNGNCRLWVLYQNNEPVGRIAAFWTEAKSK